MKPKSLAQQWARQSEFFTVHIKEDGKEWELYYVADDENDAIIAAASLEATNPNLSVKIEPPKS